MPITKTKNVRKPRLAKQAKDRFFAAMERNGLALTYDDVRLKTGHSKTMPSAVSMASQFSRNITLQCPMVSSPMDTVTESSMAIAMAMEGGLGIIHRNLTAEQQATEVARVKSHLNALIMKPVCIKPDQTMAQVAEMRKEGLYPFHSFPVTDEHGALLGIVTKTDFDFCDNPNMRVHDIMSRKLLTASSNTTLDEAFELMRTHRKKVLPLIDRGDVLKGMYVISDIQRIRSGKRTNYNTDARHNLRVGAAISTGGQDIERAEMLVQSGVDVIVIDTAHGDSVPVFESLKTLKKKFPNIDIVVGNISEGASAKRLIKAGADGIRVGQGGGSICTTRIVAGIGCPQVTAIYNCAKAARGSGVPICADGGIKNSGDIPIAIGAGAQSVMMGKMLAGTDESPGVLVQSDGGTYKQYRGMGSLAAMRESAASRKRYGQNDTGKDLVPEGVEGMVPYQGSLSRVLYQYIGGLRAGMGYVGAANIAELIEKTDFNQITNAGLKESHPHDITLIRQPPNYNPRD